MAKIMMPVPDRCVGCRICEQWCSYAHLGEMSPVKSRIKIRRSHAMGTSVPLVCVQCRRPLCIEVCTVGALSKDDKTGAVIVDREVCTGCALCVQICPRGAVRLDPEDGAALVCDLCGGTPQCARHCPEGALRYIAPAGPPLWFTGGKGNGG